MAKPNKSFNIYGKLGEDGEIKLITSASAETAGDIADELYRSGYRSVIMLENESN